MRDLGDRVGMRAQSICSYFASKHEIYDAMFLEGYQAFAERIGTIGDEQIEGDPVAAAKVAARLFVVFCASDPTRYQLLFQRTIPDFEPSPASYAAVTGCWVRQPTQSMSVMTSASGLRSSEGTKTPSIG